MVLPGSEVELEQLMVEMQRDANNRTGDEHP